MESDRSFDKEIMKKFVVDKIFGGIPLHAIETWIQHACLPAPVPNIGNGLALWW